MLNVCETVCNRDVSVCLWQSNTDYASNSIFSGVTLRDYICNCSYLLPLPHRVLLTWYNFNPTMGK